MSDRALSARARIRAEMTAEILAAARLELAEVGPAGLALRSVARRLGMVPSALYRYFDSRDALLTELIVDSYREVGAAAAAAEMAAAAGGRAGMRRWLAVCAGVREWARAHPQQWALVYGSPVPGYRAPEETVDAALLVTRVVAGIVGAGGAPVPEVLPPVPAGFAALLEPMRDELLPGAAGETVAGALLAWTALIGMVSLELFGHFEGATTDFGPVFQYSMEVVGRLAGIGPATGADPPPADLRKRP